MTVYVTLMERYNDRVYEDSIYEFDRFVCVHASWAEAIRFIMCETDKEMYYPIDPEWDDVDYMTCFELMPYKREMLAGLEDEPAEHFSTTNIAKASYEDVIHGNMTEQYYIRVAEI